MSRLFSSFSPAFVVPQRFYDSLIRSIEVFDVKSKNLGLKFFNARHCFCILTLEDYSIVRLQAGKNDDGLIEISYKQNSKEQDYSQIRSLIKVQTLLKCISFKRLGQYIQKTFYGKKYIITDYNCYDVIKQIMQWCGFQQEAKIIDKKSRIQIRKGLSAATAVQGAIFGAVIGGAIGCVVFGVLGKAIGWTAGKLLIEK